MNPCDSTADGRLSEGEWTMIDKGRLRLSVSGARAWKWLLGLGVGAGCAATLLAAGGNALPPPGVAPEVAALNEPLQATGTATTTPLATEAIVLPAVVEPPPATTLPPEKPRFLAGAPKAGRFEACLPDCETRDPRLVGEAPIPPKPVPYVHTAPPPRKGMVDVALDGGKVLADRVGDASRAVVHGTKRAFGAAVDLVW